MLKKMRVWAFLGAAGLVLVGTLVLAGGKPAANVQLRATFVDVTDNRTPCTIMNDDQGPYVTDGREIRVWISGDVGDLHFQSEHHSGRSLKVIFPPFNGTCGSLPDTTVTPVDFFRFRTINLSGYSGPKVNLLTMTPGIDYEVRLEALVCTAEEHYFFLAYNEPYLDAKRGLVNVVASASGGKLVKWVFTPRTGTGDIAYIKRWVNNKEEFCFYTEAPMPFKLILERLN